MGPEYNPNSLCLASLCRLQAEPARSFAAVPSTGAHGIVNAVGAVAGAEEELGNDGREHMPAEAAAGGEGAALAGAAHAGGFVGEYEEVAVHQGQRGNQKCWHAEFLEEAQQIGKGRDGGEPDHGQQGDAAAG